jgi:hypothetical protein
MVSVWTFRSFLSWSSAALAFLNSCVNKIKIFPFLGVKEEFHETAHVKSFFSVCALMV